MEESERYREEPKREMDRRKVIEVGSEFGREDNLFRIRTEYSLEQKRELLLDEEWPWV